MKIKKQSPAMYEPRKQTEEYSKFARPGSVAKTKIHPAINTVSIREDGLSFKSIPSLTTQGGSTAKKADTQYTGSSMIGVSIVHKSHLSPVFSNEHAIDLASMRR